jgi:hypothetical protein
VDALPTGLPQQHRQRDRTSITHFSTQSSANMTSISWTACSNPGNSNHGKSACSITAVLSLLCFIYQLYFFCQEPLPEALSLFCDSKSLLDKTRTYLEHSRFYPQHLPTSGLGHCSADSLHLVHVKAHQDDTTSFHDLAAESQLNVRANTLAKAYNSVSHHKASTVPRLPCNAAQLHCQSQTVTSRYRQTVLIFE